MTNDSKTGQTEKPVEIAIRLMKRRGAISVCVLKFEEEITKISQEIFDIECKCFPTELEINRKYSLIISKSIAEDRQKILKEMLEEIEKELQKNSKMIY